MTVKMCMGNPINKSQCEKCARLPKNAFDENEAKSWLNWKKVKTPCEDFQEPDK